MVLPYGGVCWLEMEKFISDTWNGIDFAFDGSIAAIISDFAVAGNGRREIVETGRIADAVLLIEAAT